MKYSVLIACHNRRELTVRSVTLAQASAEGAGVELSFIVFDDGSSDGTANALRRLPVHVEILNGDGTAYWANGMAQAEAAALGRIENPEVEYLLWLNDDVALDSDALTRLTALATEFPDAVIVGATREPNGGATSYSGLCRVGLHPLSFRLTEPAGEPLNVDTFNGNVVLVPVKVARNIGGIDGRFSHAFADIDYGIRCGHANVPIVLTPGTVGTCARGASVETEAICTAWRRFTGRKGGGNYSSLRLLLKKDHGASWPMVIVSTYALWWLRRIPAIFHTVRALR